ncbi:MAG: hypothetical protein ACLFMY_07250 [Guyparkeria sp.]|uniref:hypothetical protein n=1 Tax=Guyparkeria sp. TaxID=2035736 RepID=UPI00397E5840
MFHSEQPDPLPEHDFSGYPVSVGFNPAHFSEPPESVSLRLFEQETGREVPAIVQRQQDNDPHGLLTAHQFVLFPGERLGWGQAYRVELRYRADGRQHHAWTFRTRAFDAPLHEVTEGGQTVQAEAGRPFLLYVPPGEATRSRDVPRGESAMATACGPAGRCAWTPCSSIPTCCG